jgi:hypothetical protein
LTYGGDASWIRLYTSDAGFFRFADHFRGDGFVKVQGHEIVYIRLDGAETVPVCETLLHGGDGWDEVGLLGCEFMPSWREND